jgi:hypothetical protein
LRLKNISAVCTVLIELLCSRSGECRLFFVTPDESIQARVDSTAFSDTVIIEDGEYDETVLIIGKSLTLASRYLLDGDTCHIAATILRPDQARIDTGSCILIASEPFDSARTVVSGFTCLNGMGSRVLTGSGLNEIIGGGIVSHHCNSLIEDCVVEACQAQRGGGIAIYGNVNEEWRDNQIRGVVIRDCHSEAWGGGAVFAYTNLVVSDCQFLQNESPADGSAFYAFTCSLRVATCQVDSNYGSTAVGLILGAVEVDHCHFSRNASSTAGFTDITAVRCQGRIHHCVFEDNTTPTTCFYFYNIYQALPFFESNIVRNCRGTNVSSIMHLSSSETYIERNLFQNNLTGGGAVIVVLGSHRRNTFRQNVFIDNRVRTRGQYGSVVSDRTTQGSIIDSSWISHNDAPVITGRNGDHRQFDCRNNWWGHASGPYHAELNPQGQGDTLVGDDCEFIPWLTERPDTTGWLPAISRERVPIAKTWEIVAIYPNPFNSSVTISLAGFTGADFELAVHNLLGQKVDTIQHGALTGTMLHYSAPANLSSGVYFLVARDRATMQTKKMVLLR